MYESKLCKSCSSKEISLVYDFGRIPHVNMFYTKENKQLEKTYRLRLAVCENCFLLQLLDPIKNDDMFLEYYHRSSASRDNKTYLELLANFFEETYPNRKVLEIGSNDLTLFKMLTERNIDIYGIEPAKNLFEEENKVYNDFLNLSNADDILKKFGTFDLIFGINVFAHNSNFKELFDASNLLLTNNGEIHIEVAYALKTVLEGNYDTVYHEHFCSYTLTSIENILISCGFQVKHAEELDTQGGSLRILAVKTTEKIEKTDSYTKLIAAEYATGVSNPEFYKSVAEKIDLKYQKIASFFHKNNDDIVFIGAPGRGVVTLNTQELNLKTNIGFLDDTPEKEGCLFPGLIFEVNKWGDLNLNKYQTAFILSWNYADTLQTRLVEAGFKGNIAIPFPEFEIIEV
jgi:hypothetical protein